jgi:SARP family transcriptional regulator, regulator of embCAB operon
LRESPRAALIAVHMREGNQSEALREFERYRARLGAAFGLEPTGRLRALLPR